jgi:hypothetical protein
LFPGSGEDVYEEILEVCCELLDECVPDCRVDGWGTDDADREGKEEREFYDSGASDEYDKLEPVHDDCLGEYGLCDTDNCDCP